LRATWTTIAIACGIAGVTAAIVAVAARLGAAWMARRRRVMQQMPGYQARNMNAFRSSTIVATVKRGTIRHKVLQVVFGNDGSLYVSLPYFAHRTGLLSVVTFPATGRAESFVNLETGGRVTSHLVKYSHHSSGLALFSQTGKVRSEIRRQSVALDRQEGHLFTVLINGLQAFKRAVDARDAEQVTPDRTVLTFQLPMGSDPENTLKIVGRWYDVNRLRFSNPTDSAGPLVATIDQDGQQQLGPFLQTQPNGLDTFCS
jgi:hypothetical protein